MSDTTTISNAAKATMAQAAQTAKPTAPEKAPQAKTAVRAPATAKPAAKKSAPPKKAAPPKRVNVAPAAPKAPPIDMTPSMVNLSFNVMVTLDLTKPTFFEEKNSELKSLLSRHAVPSDTPDVITKPNNFYNPFRAVSKKTLAKDPTAATGALRNAFKSVLGIAAQLDNQHITYIGGRHQVATMMNSMAEAFRVRVENALGVPQDALLVTPTKDVIIPQAEILNPDGSRTQPDPIVHRPANATDLTLKMSEIISVESWANTNIRAVEKPIVVEGEDANGNDDEVDNSITSAVFVNLRINSAALYASKDISEAVMKIKEYLETLPEKLDEENGAGIQIVFAVNTTVDALADGRYISLLAATNEDGWYLCSRAQLEAEAAAENTEDAWMPTASEIGTKLLSENGDIYMFTALGGEEEADDEESESADEEADDSAE